MARPKDNNDHTHDAFTGQAVLLILSASLAVGLFVATNWTNDIGHDELFERVEAVEFILDCPPDHTYVDSNGEHFCLKEELP